MFSSELSLIQNNQNIDELAQRADYKIIKALSLHNQYLTKQFTILFEQIRLRQQIIPTLKKLNPIIHHYWQALTSSLSSPSNFQQNLQKWKKLQHQKLFSRPYLEIGLCFQNMGKDDCAIEWYEKCLMKFPENDMGYYFKGRNLLKRKMMEQAVIQLKIGLKINGQNIYILQTFAEHYENKQKWPLAIQYLQIMQDIEPSEAVSIKISQLKQKKQISRSKNRQIQQKKQLPISKPTQKVQVPLKIQEKKLEIKKHEIKIEQHKQVKPDNKIILNDTKLKLNDVKKELKDNKLKLIDSKEKQAKFQLKEKPLLNIEEQRMVKLQKKISKQEEKVQQQRKKQSKQAEIQSKPQFQALKRRIDENQQEGSRYWPIIQYYKNDNCSQKALEYILKMIQNSKRDYAQTIRICKQLQQMYYLCQQNKKVFQAFDILQKHNKLNVFTFLYHTHLCIVNQDRAQSIKGIDASKIVLFVDEQLQNESMRLSLQSYFLLFQKLIGEQRLDILSLQEYFKAMLIHLENCYIGKYLAIDSLIEQQVILKNIIVQSSNQFPTSMLYLPDLLISHKSLKDIFLREQIIYIATTPQELRRRISKCMNIIVFSPSLIKLQKQLQRYRQKLEVYILLSKQEQIRREEIERICIRMRQYNARIKCMIQQSYNSIWMYLLQKQSQQ